LELGLAAKLVNEIVEAADESQLSRTIARYGRVDLLRCLGPSCRRPPCLPSSGRGLGPDLST
jgi:hypothetical protein